MVHLWRVRLAGMGKEGKIPGDWLHVVAKDEAGACKEWRGRTRYNASDDMLEVEKVGEGGPEEPEGII